jgi:hypothetical protein
MSEGNQRNRRSREQNLIDMRKVIAMPERRNNHLTRTFVAEISQKEKKRAGLVSEKTGLPRHFAFDGGISRFIARRLRQARSTVNQIVRRIVGLGTSDAVRTHANVFEEVRCRILAAVVRSRVGHPTKSPMGKPT